MSTYPEYESVELFVEYLLEDDRDTFTAGELVGLSKALGRTTHDVRSELEGYGIKPAGRAHEKHVRGFTTSSHDRWFGPGSCPTHGGSGFDNRP